MFQILSPMPQPLPGDVSSALRTLTSELWQLNWSEESLAAILSSVSKLQTELEVRKALASSVELLRSHAPNSQLPYQRANRVRHCIKFVFEVAKDRYNDRTKDRRKRLGGLDSASLELCGLTYTIRELIEMRDPVFNFLLDKLPSFAEDHQLSSLLSSRDDIHKAVMCKLDPEDTASYRAFLASHNSVKYPNNRPAAPEDSPESDNREHHADVNIGGVGPATAPEHGRDATYVSGQARADQVSLLGPWLSEAVFQSHQWQEERRNGEAETACVSITFPRYPQDVFLTLWLGHDAGLQVSQDLGLVPVWLPGDQA